jgi:hypothetical protein
MIASGLMPPTKIMIARSSKEVCKKFMKPSREVHKNVRKKFLRNSKILARSLDTVYKMYEKIL